jgi:large subunit ribosomal protein L21
VDSGHKKRLRLPDPASSQNESEGLFMFAIIETGGKQYKVSEGDVIFIEKLDVSEGDEVKFDRVLGVSADDGFTVGAPYIEGAIVTAKAIKNGKGKKIHVLTYKPKKNEKRKIGHRQPYTKVQIETIAAGK